MFQIIDSKLLQNLFNILNYKYSNKLLLIFLISLFSIFSTASANGCLLEDDRNSVYVSIFEDAPIGRISDFEF